MIHESIRSRYEDLEADIIDILKNAVRNSKEESDHVGNCPVLNVNLFDYEELAIINGELVWMDGDGMQYSLWCEVDLSDLVDIISTNSLDENE